MELYRSQDIVIDVFEQDFEPAPYCCIYQVPNCFRRACELAFSPELISIGPFYFGHKKYAEMEKQKKRYMKKFCQRFDNDNNILENMVSFLRNEVNQIRMRYSKSFTELTDSKFVKMILYDAVFIIELFLIRHDLLLNKTTLRGIIWKDLMILENQIPFFVLATLYGLASPPPDYPKLFLELACTFFGYDPSMIFNEQNIEHFTDLHRRELAAQRPQFSEPGRDWTSELCTATTLYKAGVEFKAVDNQCLLDVKLDKNQLVMPSFLIDCYFENYTRNIIAFEQCHSPAEAYLCAYIVFLAQLINTVEDVELIVDHERSYYKRSGQPGFSGEYIINSLSHGVAKYPRCYEKIAEELVNYYRSSFHRTWATFKQVYFPNLLRGTISTTAFLVVVIFTFTQTLVAILERLKP